MKNAEKLIDFINKSPTAYHAVAEVANRLRDVGFTEISEGDIAAFSDGGCHYVIRSDSSLIAFCGSGDGFSVAATHCDTPAFKIKGDFSTGAYLKLDTEKYGGSILYSWLDRPLGIAGRVVLETSRGVEARLVNLARPVAVIPSVAIHQNRSVNDGVKLSAATDMLPLAGLSGEGVLSAISRELGICEVDILSSDLYVYNLESGTVAGLDESLILSPRLDNLECTYSALCGFLSAIDAGKNTSVLAIFDNEEVGSVTAGGADSTFLSNTLKKIAGSREKYARMLENALMLSADNAHAIHPNHPELSDKLGAPALGSGVVIKYNANKRYATDGISAAITKKLAKMAGAGIAEYYCRADMPCGSTIGSITASHVGMLIADIGLPQLAMHSATECAAVADLADMIALMKAHFSVSIEKRGAEYLIKND